MVKPLSCYTMISCSTVGGKSIMLVYSGMGGKTIMLDTDMSQCMKFPTLWYVPPAKA